MFRFGSVLQAPKAKRARVIQSHNGGSSLTDEYTNHDIDEMLSMDEVRQLRSAPQAFRRPYCSATMEKLVGPAAHDKAVRMLMQATDMDIYDFFPPGTDLTTGLRLMEPNWMTGMCSMGFDTVRSDSE